MKHTIIRIRSGGQSGVDRAALDFARCQNTDAAYRRQGIGFAMTNMLIEAAWNRGATEISLDATESGRALYIKCGFKDSDECMVLVRDLRC